MEPLAREHHAGFHELFVELAHFGQKLLAWHHACFGVLGRPNQNHESHFRVSYRLLPSRFSARLAKQSSSSKNGRISHSLSAPRRPGRQPARIAWSTRSP